MYKPAHEIRDPIHVFIKLDNDERSIVDSAPFQRLRSIHQLAMTYLVYPGASHKRFEHSLGVMELAGKIFDVITHPSNISEMVRSVIPDINSEQFKMYWRKALRVAALCHDIGHLPFSHAAEKELFPPEWDHERMTVELIRSDEMSGIFSKMIPRVMPEDVIKLAVGPKKLKGIQYTTFEAILSEIITGDAFGADRIDYLLRDSYHLGVAYGKFDHHRLIDTLRILSQPEPDNSPDSSKEPTLGVEIGGIHTAESLILARYFMYTQVYFHPVRRIYDIHLKDFLKTWLPTGFFSTEINQHLRLTDNEVISALRKTAEDRSHGSFMHSDRIINRKHFKLIYSRNPNDIILNVDAVDRIWVTLVSKYGKENLRRSSYIEKGNLIDFPVQEYDQTIISSVYESDVLKTLKPIHIDYIFINPDLKDETRKWLAKNKNEIIQNTKE